MNERQRAYLEALAQRIPHLFEAIRRGNDKSEFIIGQRQLDTDRDTRQVRLKLVAEVVDPGANPLATHSQGRTPSADTDDDRDGPGQA